MEIWNQMIQKLNEEEFEEVAMTAKMIWMRRNSVTHGKGLTHPNMIVKWAKEGLQAFKRAQDYLTSLRPNTLQMAWSWEKSPEGTYKVNWDAVIDKSKGKIGIRVIIRDSKRQVIGNFQNTGAYANTLLA